MYQDNKLVISVILALTATTLFPLCVLVWSEVLGRLFDKESAEDDKTTNDQERR